MREAGTSDFSFWVLIRLTETPPNFGAGAGFLPTWMDHSMARR